jgi:23S rRNA (cytidine1920-2'-O)/16S rRNA (cytidine1409-2'-O)-methyltransferase
MAGRVYSGSTRIEKPGQKLNSEVVIELKEKMPFVGRGGVKLTEILDTFGVSVEEKVAADLGSSTGGFTDCLLQKGARKVFAVDVDTRQLDLRLREDTRVVLIEKNARYLEKNDFGESLDIITVDLSFISVIKVLPAIKNIIGNGKLVALIKPQFEVGKGQVGKKGVVREPRHHEEVLCRMIDEAEKLGFHTHGLAPSPIKGQKGNREFFILWTTQESALEPERIGILVKEAVWNEKN